MYDKIHYNKKKKKKNAVRKRGMWARKEKGNLPLPVSNVFLRVFHRYSPPPRINNTAATAPRMPGKRSALTCLAESVFLKHRGQIS